MIVRLQYLILIYTLCYVVKGSIPDVVDNIQTCDEHCASSFVGDDQGEYLIEDKQNVPTDSESSTRTQRHTESTETNNITKEERPARCALGAKRLRPGDADKIAQYFMNDGPLIGNSHFAPAKSSLHPYSDISRHMKNPLSHPIFQPLHIPLYTLPTTPLVSSANPYFSPGYYNPFIGSMNLANRLPMSQPENIVGSILPNKNFLSSISNTLEKIADVPSQSMVGAQSLINHLITQGLPHTPIMQPNKVASTNTVPQDNLIGSTASNNSICNDTQVSSKPDDPDTMNRNIPNNRMNQQIVGSSYNPQQFTHKIPTIMPMTPFPRQYFVGAPFPMYSSHAYSPYTLYNSLNPYNSVPFIPQRTQFLPPNPIVTPPHLQKPVYTPVGSTKESSINTSPQIQKSMDIPKESAEETSPQVQKSVDTPKLDPSIITQPTSPEPEQKLLSSPLDTSKDVEKVAKTGEQQASDNIKDATKSNMKQCKKKSVFPIK